MSRGFYLRVCNNGSRKKREREKSRGVRENQRVRGVGDREGRGGKRRETRERLGRSE